MSIKPFIFLKQGLLSALTWNGEENSTGKNVEENRNKRSQNDTLHRMCSGLFIGGERLQFLLHLVITTQTVPFIWNHKDAGLCPHNFFGRLYTRHLPPMSFFLSSTRATHSAEEDLETSSGLVKPLLYLRLQNQASTSSFLASIVIHIY